MNVELDTAARALYLRLAAGTVANTVPLAGGAVADLDDAGNVLGVEIVHAADLASVLRANRAILTLPTRASYRAIDTGKSWEVEAGAGVFERGENGAAKIADLHGAFVAALLADRRLLERIPNGATLVLERDHNPHSLVVHAKSATATPSGGVRLLGRFPPEPAADAAEAGCDRLARSG